MVNVRLEAVMAETSLDVAVIEKPLFAEATWVDCHSSAV